MKTIKNQKETREKRYLHCFKGTELRDLFGTSVTIQQGKRKGKIEIEYFSKEDLERILDLMNQGK